MEPSETLTTIPRTPSRVGKRTWYGSDQAMLSLDDRDPDSDQQQQQQQRRREEDDHAGEVEAAAESSSASNHSLKAELEETRKLVRAFEAIDQSMTEARDKLKTFYKTADETNTLLDMWIRLLSQAEHTQNLLLDQEWEGRNMEEAYAREQQEKRTAYQHAMEDANRRQSLGNSQHHHLPPSSSNAQPTNNLGHSLNNSHQNHLNNSTTLRHQNPTHPQPSATTFPSSSSLSASTNLPLKKSPSALAAAAHAHASAIAASKRRVVGGVGAGGNSSIHTDSPSSLIPSTANGRTGLPQSTLRSAYGSTSGPSTNRPRVNRH